MIAFIQGEIYEVREDNLLIMVNGLGYQVFTPVKYFEEPVEVGQDIFLYTHFYLREDICMLFGFVSQKELELFTVLIGVNGVGAKTALTMLNSLSYSEIIQSIQFGNSVPLTKIPGIGKKTAERILLELKDKIIKRGLVENANMDNPAPKPINNLHDNIKNTAVAAMTQLGYNMTLANKYVTAALNNLEPNSSLEEIITAALKEAAGN